MVVLESTCSFTTAQLEAVRTIVQNMVGATILSESNETITVKNLLSPSDVSIRQSVVHLHFVVLSIHREATAAFVNAESDAFERISERANEANRLCKMITRHFNRSLISLKEVDQLGTDRSELFDCYRTARELVRIVGLSQSIAREASRLETELPESETTTVETVARLTGEVIEDAGAIVLDPDGQVTAHSVLGDCDTVQQAIEESQRAVSGGSPGSLPVIRALAELDKTVEHASLIAEVAIQRSLRKTHVD
jgi:phosphate uptake regulator